jgi:hypothetical protein
MIDDQQSKVLVNCVKSTIKILKTEGFVGLRRRIKNRLNYKSLQSHNYVVRYESRSSDPLPAPEIELEIRQITASDNPEIDELTDLDEWKIPKRITLKKLEEGWLCYIAKHKGRIVGINWVVLESFDELYFRRQFNLSPNETYHLRGWCIKPFRGKGVMPFLLRHNCDETALKYGKTIAYGYVVTSNKPMHRSLAKSGWLRVGRVGFIEVFGIRFHYLWGRHAFKETKRRLFIQDLGRVHPVFRGVIL